jgi:hypothetical protein
MVEVHGTGVGAWLMHLLLYRCWCMVDALFSYSCGTQLMLGRVQVDGLVHAWSRHVLVMLDI